MREASADARRARDIVLSIQARGGAPILIDRAASVIRQNFLGPVAFVDDGSAQTADLYHEAIVTLQGIWKEPAFLLVSLIQRARNEAEKSA